MLHETFKYFIYVYVYVYIYIYVYVVYVYVYVYVYVFTHVYKINNRIKGLYENLRLVITIPFHKRMCSSQAKNCVQNLNLGVVLIMLIGMYIFTILHGNIS